MARSPERDFIFDLGDRMVYAESALGFDRLGDAEKVVYCVYQLDAQVLDGGFSQFFDNPTGAYAGQTLDALRAIGAPAVAALLRGAMDVFPGGVVPTDGRERYERLQGVAEAEATLDALDAQYYTLPDDDLMALLFRYASGHAGKFRHHDQIVAMHEAEKASREMETESLEAHWSRRERPCPKCGTAFTSIKNRGRCPSCGQVFLASHPELNDYPT